MFKLPLITALMVVALAALPAESKTHNPRETCMQEARSGGSPGGTTITEDEKKDCDDLPDIEVTEA